MLILALLNLLDNICVSLNPTFGGEEILILNEKNILIILITEVFFSGGFMREWFKNLKGYL